jgi:hypothetical protein
MQRLTTVSLLSKGRVPHVEQHCVHDRVSRLDRR